jgi:Protein of unknown function (DUF3631)
MKTDAVIFENINPHHNPVQLAELLTEVETVIKRHVILNEHAAAALAVWVLHTFTFEWRDTVAYVAIESPEKRCGKTTLLSVLAAMACKPLIASNITVGALFRAIDTCSPTLFIDEADTFLAGNSAMRGIINSGNTRRTAYVLRLAASKLNRRNTWPALSYERPLTPALSPDGGEGELSTDGLKRRMTALVGDPNAGPVPDRETGLKRYSCWCPKVIAMIGEVPDTIGDRSIVVKMSRKLTTETCAPLAELDTEEIKAKCVRFALDAAPFIAAAEKARVEGLNDRAADTFDPLYVIARLAGEGWEKKLQAAAIALAATDEVEKSGSGLLLDIVDLFFDSGRDKIFTRDLVARLRDGGMKSQSLKYSSINEYQISKILRPYGIKPASVRIGAEVKNGYVGADFREALGRYVTPADFQARVEAIRHRAVLQTEADAEAAEQRKQMETMLAEMRQKRARELDEFYDPEEDEDCEDEVAEPAEPGGEGK